MLMRKKGQSTLEYALIIAVVVIALIAIVNYMGRSMQGRLKSSSDEIGNQFDSANGWQTGWKVEGDGSTTVTDESRDVATGATTSDTTVAEVIETNEYDEHGAVQPSFHVFP
jgi:uncharacterized protein (UPF0333 family)